QDVARTEALCRAMEANLREVEKAEREMAKSGGYAKTAGLADAGLPGAAAPAPRSPPLALSRQQRRALERQERKAARRLAAAKPNGAAAGP
ncbi:MAG: hypothetical protein OEM59_12660, partial [Rhodospirillales bacterium]|nr:hypothetical protein [Rhodospirillales bacterium]